MGAHARGAVHDGALDHFCAACIDVFHREIALHRCDRGNGLRHAAMIVPAAAEQAGLVQVNMGIDKAGQGELAADVDLGSFAGEAGFDGDDTPAGDADIDRFSRGPRPGVAKDQVEGGFGVHGTGQAGGYPNLAEARSPGSPRLCAVLRPNCSKYVHAVWRADCSVVPSGEAAMSVAAKAELQGMSDAEVVEAYLTASMIPDPG